MMSSDFIVDVSDETFEYEVLNFSVQTPVIMDFWAPWCIPCRVQSPLLANLAEEAEGAFRLARVNVDEQPKLAARLKVTNLPSIKAVMDGRMVAEYSGILSEDNLRAFVSRILPKKGNLLLEKGESLLILGDYDGAESALQEYLEDNYNDPAGLLAYARVLLLHGEGKKAQSILNIFPPSREFNQAQLLKPVAKAYNWVEKTENENASPLEAAYRNGLKLAKRGNLEIALDGFLDVLRKDKNFRNGEVREVFLGLLEALGEAHPEVRHYRAELSNVLF